MLLFFITRSQAQAPHPQNTTKYNKKNPTKNCLKPGERQFDNTNFVDFKSVSKSTNFKDSLVIYESLSDKLFSVLGS